MNKKFAIFDMDGTLVDSMAYWDNLVISFLESKGVSYISDKIIKQIETMTMIESAELFIKEFNLSGTTEELVKEMNFIMDNHYKNDIPLKNGVKEYLEYLHRNGVKMCVASATAEHLMKECLNRLGVLKYFDFLLSCENIGVGKDRPDIYFLSAQKLGRNPIDIAVYEDAIYAVKTAKKAGFYVIGVYDNGSNKYWGEIKNISDEFIYNFEEEI